MAGISRKFCAHCEEMVAPRTFREHLRLYYDGESHSWRKRMKRSDSAEHVSANESCSNPDPLKLDDTCTLVVSYQCILVNVVHDNDHDNHTDCAKLCRINQ